MQLTKNINKKLLKEQIFPTYDIEKKLNCILHFGVGNFHRAHQALYIHELLENNKNISIVGVNLRSNETNLKLIKQDYLYTLVRISKDFKEIKILNPIKKILFGKKDKIEIRNLIASKDIKLITLTVTKNLIYEFLTKIYPQCLKWFLSNVEFPLSMVDGIVPNNNKNSKFFNIPYEDNSIVVTDPYRDWYIQSDNVALKKILNNKNIIFVNNINFYENIKLKILNGAHSSLAYLGILLGHTHVHEAMADKICFNFISQFLDLEVLPTFENKDNFDIKKYKNNVLSRFKNPYIEDKLMRIAMDGSLKIPIRLLDTYKKNKNKTPYIDAIITSWILFLQHMIVNNKSNLSDSNKEFIINTYENDKENFVLNLLNQKNLFNLNEYQKINLEKNIINNINQIKKVTFTNFLSNLVFK